MDEGLVEECPSASMVLGASKREQMFVLVGPKVCGHCIDHPNIQEQQVSCVGIKVEILRVAKSAACAVG